MDITSIVTTYLNSQSFKDSSFAEARRRLDFDGGYIEFDSFSLNIYKHNIPEDYHKAFNKVTRQKYHVTNEVKKAMTEYSTLYHLIPFLNGLYEAEIVKCDRPDFEVCINGERIGIEVTELTTEMDKLTERVVYDNSDSILSEKDISKQVIAKHGGKAKQLKIHKLGDFVGVERPAFESSGIFDTYIQQIIRKYEKYKQVMEQYDEFFILCDASKSFCITQKTDIARFCDLLIAQKFQKRCTVIVLYQNEFCANACLAVQFEDRIGRRL